MRLALILIAASALSTGASAQFCTVVAVADGDTVKVRCEQGEQITIRLAGIDAPEKKQAFGQRSKQALSDLCHQVPAVITPRSKDRYGRTVADVECHGMDAGAELVKAGMAWVFDRYAAGYGHLYQLQDAARAAHIGLWSDPAPQPPWEWRHQ